MKTKTKELLASLKKDIGNDVAAIVTPEVVKSVTAELEKKFAANPQLKTVKKSKSSEKALKYFKARFNKDIFGTDSEDLKLGAKLVDAKKKDLDTGTAGSGEEIAPVAYGNEVIRIAGKYGVARQNSRVITLPAKTFKLPTLGNVIAYRVNEKGAITASSPLTGELEFNTKKLAVMIICSIETIEDANIDVLNWLTLLAGEALAKKEDEWAFRGLAAGEGIFRNASVPAYILGTGKDAFEDVTFDDPLSAMSLVDENVVGNLIWLSSFSMFNHFRSLKNAVTGEYIYQNPGQGMPNVIWNQPVKLSNVMPKLSDSAAESAFMAGYDPNYLMIGDRKAITVEFSKEATVTSSDGETTINLFEQDMVAIKFTERLDIQLAEPAKAFVRLETNETVSAS